MIVPLRKYLFFGAKEILDPFFERAQNQGYIEFIHPSHRKAVEVPEDVQALIHALKILRKLPLKKPYLGGGSSAFAVETAHRIIALRGESSRLAEEMRILEAEIVRVAPFGDFAMETIDFIEDVGKRKIQFWCMKTAKSARAQFPDEVIYVNTVYDLDYFVSINPEKTVYPGMIEMRIDRSVGQLQNHYAFVKESLHLIEAELKGLAGHIDFLHHALLEKLNDYHLAAAKKEVQFPLGPTIFVVEAWIPENKVAAVYSMMDGMAIDAEQIAIHEQESVPTCMENKGVNHIGEDLVRVYDIPSSRDKDPSGWVFWVFALFFAIIVSDGGYGLIFLALAAYLYYKFPKIGGAKRRLLKLTTSLAVSCIIWGVLTASFFGIEFNPHSPFSKYSLLGYVAERKADYHFARKDDVYQTWVTKFPQTASATNGEDFLAQAIEKRESADFYAMFDEFKDNVLFELALFLGLIHISISFLRYLRRNLAGIGWIAFMIGGYLYFPSMLHASSFLNYLGVIRPELAAKIGIQLIYVGIIIAVVLALIQKRLKGLSEITVLMSVFADVLSYLRLYALALAGSMMASTFNDIGVGMGLVLGAIMILFGHAVNITLGIGAGVIHGLRLNFIEWYHYSFEGGGRLFNPLKKLKLH